MTLATCPICLRLAPAGVPRPRKACRRCLDEAIPAGSGDARFYAQARALHLTLHRRAPRKSWWQRLKRLLRLP